MASALSHEWRLACLFIGILLAFRYRLVSLLSHRLLYSLTTGGKGVGWLWPWRDERFFAPWQVIRVAPFKLEVYFTARGEAVILSELYWVWLLGVVLMLALMGWWGWKGGDIQWLSK